MTARHADERRLTCPIRTGILSSLQQTTWTTEMDRNRDEHSANLALANIGMERPFDVSTRRAPMHPVEKAARIEAFRQTQAAKRPSKSLFARLFGDV